LAVRRGGKAPEMFLHPMANKTNSSTGRLLVVGGAEDMDEDDMCILPRLVELAGGSKARIIVCAVATGEPEETLRDYGKVLRKLKVAEVIPLSLREREEGNAEEVVELLDRATCFFMTGGDQLRITSVLAGTTLAEQLRKRHQEQGLLVAGTSAGAAAMSYTMISGGDAGTVRRADVELAPGLGYWQGTIVDTHFDRSGRVHRLMAVFGQNPEVLGIGIDEDTAAEVVPGEHFTVVGRRTVMVFDGRVTHTNAADVGPDEAMALVGSTVHVLPAGYGFDLRQKQVILPDGSMAPQ
jgi:cyanophycinase